MASIGPSISAASIWLAGPNACLEAVCQPPNTGSIYNAHVYLEFRTTDEPINYRATVPIVNAIAEVIRSSETRHAPSFPYLTSSRRGRGITHPEQATSVLKRRLLHNARLMMNDNQMLKDWLRQYLVDPALLDDMPRSYIHGLGVCRRPTYRCCRAPYLTINGCRMSYAKQTSGSLSHARRARSAKHQLRNFRARVSRPRL